MSSPPNFDLFSSLRFDPLLLTLPTNTENWPNNLNKPQTRSRYYMLPYHRDRMLQAAENFGWTIAANTIRGPEGFAHLLRTLTESVDTNSAGPLKVRTLLKYDGSIKVETTPVPPVPEIVLFPKRIPPPRKATSSFQPSPLTGGALNLGPTDSISGDPPTSEAYEILPDTIKTTPSPYTSYKTTSRDMYSSARERVGIKDFAEKKEVLLVSEKEGEIMEGSLTTVYFWRDGKWVTPKSESGGQLGTTRRWALQKGLCVEGVVKVDELIDGEECWISNGVRGFQWGKIKL